MYGNSQIDYTSVLSFYINVVLTRSPTVSHEVKCKKMNVISWPTFRYKANLVITHAKAIKGGIYMINVHIAFNLLCGKFQPSATLPALKGQNESEPQNWFMPSLAESIEHKCYWQQHRGRCFPRENISNHVIFQRNLPCTGLQRQIQNNLDLAAIWRNLMHSTSLHNSFSIVP